MSTTTPQTTSAHKLDPQAWPIHVELGVIQEALRVQGEQIGAFDQFAEDQGDDAVRLRAIANVARSFADLADALAVDAKPPMPSMAPLAADGSRKSPRPRRRWRSGGRRGTPRPRRRADRPLCSPRPGTARLPYLGHSPRAPHHASTAC